MQSDIKRAFSNSVILARPRSTCEQQADETQGGGAINDYEFMILSLVIPFESIFRLLLDRGANPRCTEQVQYFLSLSLKTGKISSVQILLDRGVSLQPSPGIRNGPAMLRSAMEGGKAMMEFVFDLGFTLEGSTNRDEIYVISDFAVRCKDPEVLEFFLSKGICTKKTLHPFGSDLLGELVATRSNLEAAKAKIDLLLA